MKKVILQETGQEALSLVTDLTYAQVDHWYDASIRDMKMSAIYPKHVAGHEKLPAIIWLCGGAFVTMDRNVWLPQMVELAKRGFAVFSPEYRTANTAHFPEPIYDVKAAVRYVRANAHRFAVDVNRIFAAGESAGGYCATFTSVTNGVPQYDVGPNLEYSSAVQGVVDFYGLVDTRCFAEMERETLPDHDPIQRAACRENQRIASFFWDCYDEASATLRVTENTPPTLIFHGTGDTTVSIAQSEEYYRALCRHGVRTDYYVIEGAEHGDDCFYQQEIYDIICEFLHSVNEQNLL